MHGASIAPRNRTRRLVQVAVILLIMQFSASIVGKRAWSTSENVEAWLFMNPPSNVGHEIGELFNVSVEIASVQDLRSTEFSVAYNNTVLDVTGVKQEAFFPASPRSSFAYVKNKTAGTIKVTITLNGAETPLSGDGSLVLITFKIVGASNSCDSVPINLGPTALFDSASNQISHDSVGALYFWKSTQLDPPEGGRLLDLYTQKGGKSQSIPDGSYFEGEKVYLMANVTFNGAPVAHKLVVFEVLNALGEVVLVRTGFTDENGIASVLFSIPYLSSSDGTWTVVSRVDVAEKGVWDITTFEVYPPITVGGYTYQIEQHDGTERLAPCVALMAIFTAAFLVVKRKSTR